MHDSFAVVAWSTRASNLLSGNNEIFLRGKSEKDPAPLH
jgi:hypothetical protein